MVTKIVLLAPTLLIFSIGFTGCATQSVKRNSQPLKNGPAAVSQQVPAPPKSEVKSDSKVKAAKESKVSSGARDIAWIKNAKKNRRVELQTSALNRVNEEEAFAKVKAAFDSKSKDLVPLATAFVRRFPKSNLIDDVTYIVGLGAFENRDYGRALRSWNMVISDFPQSKKRVSALLAKAVLLKRIDMNAESKKTFLDLVKQYPQSPEAERAQIELRLMQ